MSLPELVIFSVRDETKEVRYLSITGPQRQLRYGQEEGVFSDTVKFGVEPARDGLVHIRSCFVNHYWARASRFEPWLLASVPEKVEDMSKDECTLFRPRMGAGNVFVGFVHAQSGLNVVMRPATDAHAYNLCVEHGAPTDFNFQDFASLTRNRIKLPRYMMFIGDNNMYLSPDSFNGILGPPPKPILHFLVYNNPTNRSVAFEVEYTKSGDFRLKSVSRNGFCRVVSNVRVVIETSNTLDPLDPNTLFDAVVSSPPNAPEEGIALLSRGYRSYCQRNHPLTDLIVGANAPHLQSAWLRPRNAAVQGKRRVNIDSFRNSWRGPDTTRPIVSKIYYNTTSVDRESEVKSVVYQEFRETIISNSISSLTAGPAAVFNGYWPSVTSKGELVFADVATPCNATWQKPIYTTGDETKRHNYTVHLPARSQVVVTHVMKIVTYEVPFSYQQIDEFPFGGTVTQDLFDGVFKIQCHYQPDVKIHEIRPLSAEELNGKIDMDSQNLEDELVIDPPKYGSAIDDEQDHAVSEAPEQEVSAQDEIEVTEPKAET